MKTFSMNKERSIDGNLLLSGTEIYTYKYTITLIMV